MCIIGGKQICQNTIMSASFTPAPSATATLMATVSLSRYATHAPSHIYYLQFLQSTTTTTTKQTASLSLKHVCASL